MINHGIFLGHLKKAYTYLNENRDVLINNHEGFCQDYIFSCIIGFAFKSYLGLPFEVDSVTFFAALNPHNYDYIIRIPPELLDSFEAVGLRGIQYFLRSTDKRLYDLYWTKDKTAALDLTRKILGISHDTTPN